MENKEVDGKKFTMIWHMDDLQVSHVLKRVVGKIIHRLEKHCKNMRVARGKIKLPGYGPVLLCNRVSEVDYDPMLMNYDKVISRYYKYTSYYPGIRTPI